jgi:chorismate mutase-like protein
MSRTSKTLDELRREIDGIDDSLHDLIMRRTELVAAIGAAKTGGPTFRPGREAAILRRLLKRHSGKFPREVLVRLWREIISAFLRMQGSFSVAVVSDGPDLLPLVREEYGSSTPVTAFHSAGQALGALREGRASLAVLPLPREVEERPWWPMLFGADEARPSIAARLPFAMPGQPPAEALVVARVEQAETGDDRSFIALETTDAVSRSGLKDAFTKTDLPVSFAASWQDAGRQMWLHLVEIDGYVAPDDARLARLSSAVGAGAREVRQVGGYAVPVAPALMGADLRE